MASIRKRTWKSKGVTKEAWIVDYHDNGGIRRQRTFKLKKAAEKFLASLIWELSEGIHVPLGETITVAAACDLWIERAIREQLERSTLEGYAQVARLHIKPLLGATKLNDLTKVTVERFRDELLKTRSYDRARRTLRDLKMILQEAKRLGKVAKNVAKDVVIKDSGRDKEPVTILSKQELNDFLDAADTLDPRARAFAYLITFTGIRASEARGLPWRFVDLDEGTIYIGQRADRWCVLGSPKSKKSRRYIPLTPTTRDALAAWKKVCPCSQLVFPHRSGRPLDYNEVLKWVFNPLMFAAKLTKQAAGKTRHRYPLHPFRHTAASIWIEMGFSPKRVQYLMGHSSIQLTFDLYGHLFDLRSSGAEMMRQMEEDIRSSRETLSDKLEQDEDESAPRELEEVS